MGTHDQRGIGRRNTNGRAKNQKALQATVLWEKPKEGPRGESEVENNRISNKERLQRTWSTPEYFGNPVMICGIQQEDNEATPEFLYQPLDEMN